MTREEAIKILHPYKHAIICGEAYQEAVKEACAIAVKDMGKEIPRTPLGGTDIEGNEYLICRHCSAIVHDGYWQAKYCPDCGRAVKWE